MAMFMTFGVPRGHGHGPSRSSQPCQTDAHAPVVRLLRSTPAQLQIANGHTHIVCTLLRRGAMPAEPINIGVTLAMPVRDSVRKIQISILE